ncbi:MAG: dihydroorotase [Muribaculum sp.]|nr:dihydroorotase [Muribaculum sp.]
MILLYNGTVVNRNHRFNGYVLIDGKRIADVGEGYPATLPDEVDERIDVDGALILPGVIDDQVHFRDPGLTHKGDIATESRAAAAGGVTSFMDMPNTNPPTTTIEALEAKRRRAAEVSAVNYAFFLGATNDNLPVLLTADYKDIPGVKLFLGSSTGNMLVDNDTVLEQIFSRVPALIAVHSEDEATIREARQRLEQQYGHDIPIELHPVMRSREACVVSTRRAIERARRCGTRLHVLHVSTADEANMFSDMPLSPEKRITAEVCVHHLWFCSDDYRRLGSRIKMNPAVKDEADRQILRQALRDGRLDIVATDHAPHLLSEKQGGLLDAASGAPMVQYSLPVMLELADQGVFTIEMVVEKMCHAPAKLYNIVDRGWIESGMYADIVVVKQNCPYLVTDESAVGRCGWTPLAGTTLHNRVERTYVNGQLIYSDGTFTDVRAAQPLRFNH